MKRCSRRGQQSGVSLVDRSVTAGSSHSTPGCRPQRTGSRVLKGLSHTPPSRQRDARSPTGGNNASVHSLKKEGILTPATTWTRLEDTVPSGISQSQEDQSCRRPLGRAAVAEMAGSPRHPFGLSRVRQCPTGAVTNYPKRSDFKQHTSVPYSSAGQKFK